MASASAPLVLHPSPIRRHSSAICSQSEHPLLPTRRLVLSSPAIFLMLSSPAKAEDIPLFGLRKKLKNLEEDAVEVVKEGEKVVEEGIAAAEKEVVAAEEEIVAAAEGVGVFGDLAQAGVVAGAEFVGVLIAATFSYRLYDPLILLTRSPLDSSSSAGPRPRAPYQMSRDPSALLATNDQPPFINWKGLLSFKCGKLLTFVPSSNDKASFSDDEVIEGARDRNKLLVNYAVGRQPFYDDFLQASSELWTHKGNFDLLSLSEISFLFKF